jgi:hypothetical protein
MGTREKLRATAHQEHFLYLLAELERIVKPAAPSWDAAAALVVQKRLESLVAAVRQGAAKVEDR